MSFDSDDAFEIKTEAYGIEQGIVNCFRNKPLRLMWLFRLNATCETHRKRNLFKLTM